MRKFFEKIKFAVMITAGIALFWSAAANAAASGSKRVTVTGEVVDSWCNVTMIMLAEGSAHYQCAVWCAAGGIPVAIKDEDENVYVVLRIGEEPDNVANPGIITIQAHQVTVEGYLIVRDDVNYLLVTRVANDGGIVNLTHEDAGIQPFGK